jgi:hypothetical protein
MVACLLMVAALAGCGSDEAARLSAAANTVQMPLRSLWSESYAGLEINDDQLVVYRKPDPALDAFVRERVKDVEVDFRDAPHSLDELELLTERVRVDWHYWSTRECAIKMITPRADGTGITVVVAAGDLAAAREEFRQRYGDQPITLHRPARTGVAPAFLR